MSTSLIERHNDDRQIGGRRPRGCRSERAEAARPWPTKWSKGKFHTLFSL